MTESIDKLIEKIPLVNLDDIYRQLLSDRREYMAIAARFMTSVDRIDDKLNLWELKGYVTGEAQRERY